MRKIALGICSSISIYKACEIVRGLQKESCEVQVIMTENATRLVSPLLFGALTARRVLVDLFCEEGLEEIGHVELAKEKKKDGAGSPPRKGLSARRSK